ncbi:hypothetical protein EV421DRAFT_1044393 [Armillaria borealis]|uniref:Uncharacterized protein n=1 Tax=Armillaria borealis TaxID=47425 RepID=A0AA39K1R7_9AGAR|nr:hypothetical protein EV421DRAFT_1044393 [Armillaria borealis]
MACCLPFPRRFGLIHPGSIYTLLDVASLWGFALFHPIPDREESQMDIRLFVVTRLSLDHGKEATMCQLNRYSMEVAKLCGFIVLFCCLIHGVVFHPTKTPQPSQLLFYDQRIGVSSARPRTRTENLASNILFLIRTAAIYVAAWIVERMKATTCHDGGNIRPSLLVHLYNHNQPLVSRPTDHLTFVVPFYANCTFSASAFLPH